MMNKKNIKLIALDLDGTLLDDQKRLSQKNKEALEKCADLGIEIVPCTGRIWKGIPEFIQNLKGVHYAITVNGAVIEDLVNHKTLQEKKMSVETALSLIDLGKKYHIMYDAYVNGQGYGESRFMDHMEDYNTPVNLRQMILDTRKPVPRLEDHLKEMDVPVEKLNYYFDNMDERAEVKKILENMDNVIVSSSFTNNLEINGLGATKGDGILFLAEYLGCDRMQTMGFGDGENDLSMMQLAGIGVAMQNGMEKTKAAADYITLSNEEDGVAAAIEHFIFES